MIVGLILIALALPAHHHHRRYWWMPSDTCVAQTNTSTDLVTVQCHEISGGWHNRPQRFSS